MTQSFDTSSFQFLKAFSFYKALREANADIYVVGGAVRDMILGKPVKDYDLLVTGLSLQGLIDILVTQGQLNYVGASFGILKLRPQEDLELELDIAVPRAERKIGAGHHGFEVRVEGITLEEDLYRRDFTFNSLALELETDRVVDPYGGQQDLADLTLRLTNPTAFNEDPLRMLRAIQFAARFDMTIEDGTFNAIRTNAQAINEVSGERILVEIEKITSKGDPYTGAELLFNTGLWEALTGKKAIEYYLLPDLWDHAKTPAEFVYLITDDSLDIPKLWSEKLRGDTDGAKEIEAIRMLYNFRPQTVSEARNAFYEALRKSTRVMYTGLIANIYRAVREEFRSGAMPASLAEVKISGDDLLGLGYQGKAVGDALKAALQGIYREDVLNDKAALLAYVQERLPLVNPHENTTNHTTSSEG